MQSSRKFPNGGYDVTVLRKKDVIDCIDNNILDKEIALDLIKQLELDAINFIKDGKWAGIPYIGNIRIPKHRQYLNSPEIKKLVEDSRETLDSEKYILFRRRLAADSQKRAKVERYYNYILSKQMNKNMKLFKSLAKRKGELVAKIIVMCLVEMRTLDYYEIRNYGKE